MYVRSVSNVTSTFSWKGSVDSIDVLPNVFTSQTDVWKLMETPHNKLRILRYPAAILSPYNIIEDVDGNTNKPTLTIIHDRYTTIKDVQLLYYKEPTYFDIMTSTPCELPMDCFDDLVTGAVELYINYVRGGIRQQEEEGRKQRAAQRQAEHCQNHLYQRGQCRQSGISAERDHGALSALRHRAGEKRRLSEMRIPETVIPAF